MASDDDLNLKLSGIRWHLEPFPAMDADALLEFDDVALADINNPLAVPHVAALKMIRRLSNSRSALSAVVKTQLEISYKQQI